MNTGSSVGPVGLEPTTYGLKVRSSAIELEARRPRNQWGSLRGRDKDQSGRAITVSHSQRLRPGVRQVTVDLYQARGCMLNPCAVRSTAVRPTAFRSTAFRSTALRATDRTDCDDGSAGATARR